MNTQTATERVEAWAAKLGVSVESIKEHTALVIDRRQARWEAVNKQEAN